MIKNKTILIVEDSPTQAAKLKFLLESNDFITLHGSNGKEALKLLNEKTPDIVITDIIMPEMNGYELCKTLKNNSETKDIPVILLTQLSDAEDVIKGLQSGANNFISKPYSDKFLLRRIDEILVNQEMRKNSAHVDIEVFFRGQKFSLNSERLQILDLLLSTYENAINKSKELITAHDELKKIHHELEQKNKELNHLNKEKNFFLGMAAHDLRNPLSLITSYVYLLSDNLGNKLSDDELKIFEIIKNTSTFMLNLISDILDISKIEAGILVLKKTEIDLIPFFQQIIELNNFLAKKKHIEILLNIQETKLKIIADKDKLTQVMNNLLSNAIKFSHPETKINVLIRKHASYTEICVEDQGVGIPKNELRNLFKPFSKTSVQSTAGESSTGLGLATVKKIIDAHNGTIKVESMVNKGSKFIFSLPTLV